MYHTMKQEEKIGDLRVTIVYTYNSDDHSARASLEKAPPLKDEVVQSFWWDLIVGSTPDRTDVLYTRSFDPTTPVTKIKEVMTGVVQAQFASIKKEVELKATRDEEARKVWR